MSDNDLKAKMGCDHNSCRAELVAVGALILAEIERLDRAAEKEKSDG